MGFSAPLDDKRLLIFSFIWIASSTSKLRFLKLSSAAMATCTSPSSLMLTHAASSVHSHDLNPSIRCFNPNPLFKTFPLHPLVLNFRGRNPSKCIDVNLQREARSRSHRVIVAALAAEAELAESVEEEGVDDGEGSPTNTITPPKPKKGKAALLLKRDRVSVKSSYDVSFCC